MINPQELNDAYAKIGRQDLPTQLEGRDQGSNPLVLQYRQRLMEMFGKEDPRTDAEITMMIGDRLRQDEAGGGTQGQQALNVENRYQQFRDDYLDLDLKRQDSGIGGEFMSGLESAGRGLVATGAGAYGMTGLPGGESVFNWGIDVQTNAPRASVRKFEDLFRANGVSMEAVSQYVPNVVGSAIPSLVEGVAAFFLGAGTGGAGAAAIYGAKGAAKQGIRSRMRGALRNRLNKKILDKKPKYGPNHKSVLDGTKSAGDIMDVEDYAAELWKQTGGTAGSLLNSLALNSGEIYNTLRGDGFTHDQAQTAAFAYGSMAALPDSALPTWVGRSFLKKTGLMNQSQKARDQGLGWLRTQVNRAKESVPGKLGIGMAMEGSTEGYQEFINAAAPAWERGEDIVFDDQLKSSITNASIVGAVAGGMGGLATLGGSKRDPVTESDLPTETTPYSPVPGTEPSGYSSGSLIRFTGNSGQPQVGRFVRTTGEGTQVEPVLNFDLSGDVVGVGRTAAVVTIPTDTITGTPTMEDLELINKEFNEQPTVEEDIQEVEEQAASKEELEAERDQVEQELVNIPDAVVEGDVRAERASELDQRLKELDDMLNEFPNASETLETAPVSSEPIEVATTDTEPTEEEYRQARDEIIAPEKQVEDDFDGQAIDQQIDTELDQEAAIEKRAKELASERIKKSNQRNIGKVEQTLVKGGKETAEKLKSKAKKTAKKIKYPVYNTEFDKKYKIPSTSKLLKAYYERNEKKLKSLQQSFAKVAKKGKPTKNIANKIKEKEGLLAEVKKRISAAVNLETAATESTSSVISEALSEDEGGGGEDEIVVSKEKTKPTPTKVNRKLIAKLNEDVEQAEEAVRLVEQEIAQYEQDNKAQLVFTGETDAPAVKTDEGFKLDKKLKAKRIQLRQAQQRLDKENGVDTPQRKVDEILDGLPDVSGQRKEKKKKKKEARTKISRQGGRKVAGGHKHTSASGQVDKYSQSEIEAIQYAKALAGYNEKKKAIVDDIKKSTGNFESGFITPDQFYKLIREQFPELAEFNSTNRWELEVADDILQDLRRKVGISDKQLHRLRVLEIKNNSRRTPREVMYEELEDSPATKTFQLYYPALQKEYVDDKGNQRGGASVRQTGSVDATNPISAANAIRREMKPGRFNMISNWSNLKDPLTADGEVMTLGVMFMVSKTKDTLKKRYYAIRKGGLDANNPMGYAEDFQDGKGKRPTAFFILRDGKTGRHFVTDHTGRPVRIVNSAGEVIVNPDSIPVPGSEGVIQVYGTKNSKNPQQGAIESIINVAGKDANGILDTLRKRSNGGNKTTPNLGGVKGDRYKTRAAIILEAPDGSVVMSGLSDFTSARRPESVAGSLAVLGFQSGKGIRIARTSKPARLEDVIEAGYKPMSVIRLGKFNKGQDKVKDSIVGYPEQKTWEDFSAFEEWSENVGTVTGGTRQQDIGDSQKQALPKVAQMILQPGMTLDRLDQFLEFISEQYPIDSVEDLQALFRGAKLGDILSRISTIVEPRLESDFLTWDDVLASMTQVKMGITEALQGLADARLADRDQSIADATPVETNEVLPEVEEVKAPKVTEEDYKQAEKELRAEGIWMPDVVPVGERRDYGITDRAKQIAEARDGTVKRRISDVNHEMAKRAKLDVQFGELLDVLNKSGIDVQLFQKDMESVYSYLHSNNADFNEADSLIRVVLSDILRPDGTSLLSLYHEATHFVLDSLPEVQRRAMIDAIYSANREFGEARLKDRNDRLRNLEAQGRISRADLKEATSPEEQLVEAVARNLKDVKVEKGVIRAVIRKMKELVYRILSAIAKSVGMSDFMAADLSARYLEVKMRQYVGRDNEMLPPFLSFLRGAEYTAGEMASTFKVRDANDIQDMLNPVTRKLKNPEVSPSSPMAMSINRQNFIDGKETDYTTSVRKGINDAMWGAFGDQELTVDNLINFTNDQVATNLWRDMKKAGLMKPRVILLSNQQMKQRFGSQPARYHHGTGEAAVIYLSRDFGFARKKPENETEQGQYLEIQKKALAEILGHELTHHVQEAVFANAKVSGKVGMAKFDRRAIQVKADWVALYDSVKRAARGNPMMYGLTSVEEFISEARNNPRFQRYLKSIKLEQNLADRFKIKEGRVFDALNFAFGRAVQPNSNAHNATAVLMKRTLEAGAIAQLNKKNGKDPITKVLNNKDLLPAERLLYLLPNFTMHSILERMPSLRSTKTVDEANSIVITENDYIETGDTSMDYNGDTLLPHTRYLLAFPRSEQNPNPPISEVANPFLVLTEGTGRKPADEDMWRLVRTPSFIKFYGDWMKGFQGVQGENPVPNVGFFRSPTTNEPKFIFHGRGSDGRGDINTTQDGSSYEAPGSGSRIQQFGGDLDIAGGRLDPELSDFDLQKASPYGAMTNTGFAGEDTRYGAFFSESARAAAGWSQFYKGAKGIEEKVLATLIKNRHLKGYFENFSMAGEGSNVDNLLDQDIDVYHEDGYGMSTRLGNWSPVILSSILYTSRPVADSDKYTVPGSLIKGQSIDVIPEIEMTPEGNIQQSGTSKRDVVDIPFGVDIDKVDKAVGRVFFVPGNVGTLTSHPTAVNPSYTLAYNEQAPHGMLAIEDKNGELTYYKVTKNLLDSPFVQEKDMMSPIKIQDNLVYSDAVAGQEETLTSTSLSMEAGSYNSVNFEGQIDMDILKDYISEVTPAQFSSHSANMAKQMDGLIQQNVGLIEALLTTNVIDVSTRSIPSASFREVTSEDIINDPEAARANLLESPTWQDAANHYDIDVADLMRMNGYVLIPKGSSPKQIKQLTTYQALADQGLTPQAVKANPDDNILVGSIQVPLPTDKLKGQEGAVLPVFTPTRNPLIVNEAQSVGKSYQEASSTFVRMLQATMGVYIPSFSKNTDRADRLNIPTDSQGIPDTSAFYDDVHDITKLYNLSHTTGGGFYVKKPFAGDPFVGLRNPLVGLASSIDASQGIFDTVGDTNVVEIDKSDLDELMGGGDPVDIEADLPNEVKGFLDEVTADDPIHKYDDLLPSGKSAIDPLAYYLQLDQSTKGSPELVSWMVKNNYSKADIGAIISIVEFGTETSRLDPKTPDFQMNNYMPFDGGGEPVNPSAIQVEAFRYALMQHASLARIPHVKLLGMVSLRNKMEQYYNGADKAELTELKANSAFYESARRLDETTPIVVSKDKTPFIESGDVFSHNGRLYRLQRMPKAEASEQVFGSILLNMTGVPNPPKTLLRIGGTDTGTGESFDADTGIYSFGEDTEVSDAQEYAVVTPIGLNDLESGMAANTFNWGGGAAISGIDFNNENTKVVETFIRSSSNISYGSLAPLKLSMYIGDTRIQNRIGTVQRGGQTMEQRGAGGAMLHNVPEEFIRYAARDSELSEVSANERLVKQADSLYGGNSTLSQFKAEGGGNLFDNGIWSSDTLLRKEPLRPSSSDKRLYGEAIGSNVTEYLTGGLVASSKVSKSKKLEQFKINDMVEMKEFASLRRHPGRKSLEGEYEMSDADLSPVELQKEQYVLDLIMHALADYVVNNRDGHAGNFGIANGRIVSFDKGQSLRFFRANMMDPNSRMTQKNMEDIESTMGTTTDAVINEGRDLKGVIHFINHQFGKEAPEYGNPRIVYDLLPDLVSATNISPNRIMQSLAYFIERSGKLKHMLKNEGERFLENYSKDESYGDGMMAVTPESHRDEIKSEMIERLDSMEEKVRELIVTLTGREATISSVDAAQVNRTSTTDGPGLVFAGSKAPSVLDPSTIRVDDAITGNDVESLINKKRQVQEANLPPRYAQRLLNDEVAKDDMSPKGEEYRDALVSQLLHSVRSRATDLDPSLDYDMIISHNEDTINGNQVILPYSGHKTKGVKSVYSDSFDTNSQSFKRRIDDEAGEESSSEVSVTTSSTNAFDGTQAASNRLLLDGIEQAHKDAILKGYSGNLEAFIKKHFKINPIENLKAIAERDANVADSVISDFDGNVAMTDRTIRFAAALYSDTISNLSRQKDKQEDRLEKVMDDLDASAQELSELTNNYRDATLHEKNAQASIRRLIKEYIRGMDGQVDMTFAQGQLLGSIQEVENVLKGDSLSSVYRDALYDVFDGNVKVFEYIQAMAELGIDYSKATEQEIISAIKSSTRPELQTLSANKPLLSTLVAFSKDKSLQMALLEARTNKDIDESAKIDDEIKRTQRLSADQLADLRKEIKGIRKSVSKVYKVRDAYADARMTLSRKKKQADKYRESIGELTQSLKTFAGLEKDIQSRLGVGYNFKAVPGEKYFVMQKLGDKWVATQAVYSIDATDQNRININNARHFNKAYLAEQQAAGKGDEPFNRMLEDMTYELGKAIVHREYQAIHKGFISKNLATLEQRLRALGQSGVQVARMVAEFRRISQNSRNEEAVLSGKWEGAYKDAVSASGLDQDVFKEVVYDTAIYWIENLPELADDPVALYNEVNKKISRYYKSTGKQIKPALKPALEKLWRATEEVAEWENNLADENNVLVEDPSVKMSNPLTGKRENILRRRIKYGRMTIPRRLKGDIIAVLNKIMRASGWSDAGLFKQVKTLSQTAIGEDEAYNSMIGIASNLLSDPNTIATFIEPLMNKPGDPIFTAPAKRGSKTKQPIPQDLISATWQNSGRDFGVFVKQLFLELDGDPQDLPAFTASMIDRLRQIYEMSATIASKVDSNALDPNTNTPHRMMDARTNTVFPREWLTYDTYTKVDVPIHVNKIASVSAFGRDSNILVGMLDAAQSEIRQLQIPLGEAKLDPAYQALGSDKQRKEYLIRKLGKDQYEASAKYEKMLDEVLDLKKDFVDLFAAPGGGFKDIRPLEEAAGLNQDLVLRTPKSGLWQGLSGMDFTQRLGYGTLAGKASGSFIWNSIKNVFGSLFNEGLGIPLVQASESAKAINYIRSLPGQQDLTYKQLLSNQGVQGTGETFIKGSRALKSILDKSISLKGGKAGTSGFAPFTPLSPFSWLNNVFGSAVGEAAINTWRTVITRAMKYVDNNPSVLGDPNFRFNLKHLGISGSLLGGNERALEYFTDTWAEHTGQSFLDLIKQSYNRKKAGQEILSKEDYLAMYQIAMDDIALEGGLGSTPVSFRTNGILRIATPLLRWATSKSNAVHGSLATQEGRFTINSVLKGLAGISAVGVPIGIAATMLMDEYDEEILGKKSNLRKVDPINLLPGFGVYNMLTNSEGQGLGILERLARSGNVYGLGMEALYGLAAWTDPGQGQRSLGIDRILVYSQVANLRDAFVNMMHSGWYMNYEDGKKVVDVLLGQAPAHFTQTVNNLLYPINENERRRVKRVDAYNYLRSAGRSAGVPLKKSGMRTSPTPLTSRIRQMQLAAYGDDPEEFNAVLRDAIQVAIDMGKEDPIGSIISSWKAREPMDLFQRTLTDDEIELVFAQMNSRGKENVLDLIRLHEKYLNFLSPKSVRPMPSNQYNTGVIRNTRLQYLGL